MATLDKRLQILLDESRMNRVSDAAAHEGVSVGEWVRQAIDSRLPQDSRRENLRQLLEWLDQQEPIDFGSIDDIRREIELSHVPPLYHDEFE